MLFVFLLYRLFFIAQNAPDLLGALIVTGIFAQVALQVILNIAVVLNVIPATGITLPFISYGGTSSSRSWDTLLNIDKLLLINLRAYYSTERPFWL